jgi:lysophospholipid hydrolase
VSSFDPFITVILTRFSRVTFNAAHKYLGLTSEVLRTEKAINDIACHPLPASFYEGGGLQYLRNRFDATTSSTSETDSDYFSYAQSPSQTTSELPKLKKTSTAVGLDDTLQTRKISKGQSPPMRASVQAGDLLMPKSSIHDSFRPPLRAFSTLNTPGLPRGSDDTDLGRKMNQSSRSSHWSAEDFDLREEVMSCIAKSIGLLQPPLSGSDSVEASPAFPATEHRRPSGGFSSPFGSLSLLDLGDDVSSATGGSSSMLPSGNHLSGLDNEVEILFFAAGSTLAKVGELNTGLFYVIEGFLDILLPSDEGHKGEAAAPTRPDAMSDSVGSEPWRTLGGRSSKPEKKLLFTVKPGGIAGYLGQWIDCNATIVI